MLYDKLDADILAFSYRGYSDSDGVPSENGIKADAHKIMSYVKKNLSEKYLARDGIFLHGRSLGGAVAAEAFFDEHADMIDGIILENTFTSISDMADIMFPFLAPIKKYVLKMSWDTDRLVPQITAPLMFVMGKRDEIVPYKQTYSLYKTADKALFKEKFVVPGGTHNDTWMLDLENYMERLNAFMKRAHKEVSELRQSGTI